MINDVKIQTGGFGSYLFGMSERIAKQSDDNGSFKNPSLGWIIGFLFVVSFLGLFSVLPLRKVHSALLYPSLHIYKFQHKSGWFSSPPFLR